MADPRPDRERDRLPEDDGTSAEEMVEDAIEFFSPDEEERREGDLVRHPPDGTKRDDERSS